MDACSADGTVISYVVVGSGAPVVVVGGALADHTHYLPLARALPGCAVRVYDRRGRGGSGAGGAYAVEREIEDLAAVLPSEPAVVYGHSAGAALALRASVELPIRALILADLPYELPSEEARSRHAAEVSALHAVFDPANPADAAAFFLEQMGMPADEVAAYLASPAASTTLDCARALPNDYAVLGDGTVPTTITPTIPTLILTTDQHSAPSALLAAQLPNATLKPSQPQLTRCPQPTSRQR